jgi:3-oxoacyl-[acyl-carrier-protein] synthase II
MKRVVITGIGAVTPLGNNIEATWKDLTNKRSGMAQITKFDPSGLPSRIAGELKKFNPEDYLSKKDILRLDSFIHYAAAAALMACEDAKLGSFKSSSVTRHSSLDSAGVIIGSSRGGISSMEKAMENNMLNKKPFSAYLMSSSTINMAASYISMRLGTKGPALGITTACASGTNAIGEAFRMIRSGETNIAVSGGTDSPICRLALGGYGASRSLSERNDDPEKASRPFDKDRDGFVISEGAGILILEELNHALHRGAMMYAEVGGYGTSSDAFHQTKPDSTGESVAIIKALNDANVLAEKVDYINAHATSTPLGDSEEAKAIKKVFGKRSNDIHVSSCKSMLGHMLGAAGAVEAAVTAISINKGIITPTINLEISDPQCDLNIVTSPINKDIHVAVSNSFGFGGVNAVIVLRKFQG